MSKQIVKYITNLILVTVVTFGLLGVAEAASGNIDPVNKWAWGTNVGWLNFNALGGGVTVCADHLEGFAWAENLGWVKLGIFNGCGSHTYSNTIADYGVNRDGSGNLSGYAWGTNVGWIKFNPSNGGVTINPATGSFDGYAWGENIGWIHFKNTGAVSYNVVMELIKLYLPLILR